MDKPAPLNIGERLSIVGLILGVGGLVFSLMLPLAYPNEFSPNFARNAVWISSAFIGASLLFGTFDLIIYYALRKGVHLTTALLVSGAALILIGLCTMFVAVYRDSSSTIVKSEQVNELEKISFAYVDAMQGPDRPLEDRPLIVLIKRATALTNVEVNVFLDVGVTRQFNFSAVYERGEPLIMKVGDRLSTLRLGEGTYRAIVTDLNGAYLTELNMRVEEGKLKRDLTVHRINKSDQGKAAPLLMYEHED